MKDPQPKKWTTGRVIAWVVACALIAAGLVAVGFYAFLFIALANYGSSK